MELLDAAHTADDPAAGDSAVIPFVAPELHDEEPTAAQLQARLAEERREQAGAATQAPAPEVIDAELIVVRAAIAELAKDPGPPDEQTTIALMEQLEQLAEHAGDEHTDAITGLAQQLVELTEREVPKTAEELEQLATLEELEKAREAYERKVRKIVGPEAPLVACATCDGLGFDLTGGAAEADYHEHPDYQACAACAGFGAVRTGSKVAELELQPCPTCGGRGYLKRIEREHANGGEPIDHAREPEYGLEPWMGDPAIASRS